MRKVSIVTAFIFIISSCTNSETDKVIENMRNMYDMSKISGEYVTKVYYTEYAYADKQYISFNDGVYYFLYFGEDYSIPISNFKLISDNVRKADSNDAYIYNTKNITDKYIAPTDNLIDTYNISELSDIPNNEKIYDIIRRLELYGPLSKKNYKNYDYTVDSLPNNIIELKFVPKNKNTTLLDGTIYLSCSKNSIKNILLNANNFEYINNEWTPALYDINFSENNRIKSISMHAEINGINVFRKIEFIPETNINIDISHFDTEILSNMSYYSLIVYNADEINNYKVYQDDKCELIFKDLNNNLNTHEQFANNNNNLFLNIEYQNKNERFENKMKNADSLSRLKIDNLYNYKRKNYSYNQSHKKLELIKNTELKFINNKVDFGYAPKDSVLFAKYKCVNKGTDKLYFFSVKPDCDCTSYELSSNSVNPNDTIVLTLRYDTKGKIGKIGTYAIIEANTDDKMYKIMLTGIVK